MMTTPESEAMTGCSSSVTDDGNEDNSIPHLLELKRDGKELTDAQISVFVKALRNGAIDDVQLGAFLMAVYLRNMTQIETASLTKHMMNSGTVFKWPSNWRVVDKHSTGGVGDKVSLVLAPALASLGLKVPMISGRGLAHTGGTLDKMESIYGYEVSLSEERMVEALRNHGCCIVGQTSSVNPADKKMYAARDVTATVPSLPLIVSSIISKKGCESLDSLVLDVKFGCGAFMKTKEDAEELANLMVEAGNSLGIKTAALITQMVRPLGKKIGNALEVQEALECLRGEGPEDLEEIVVSLGAELAFSSGCCSSRNEGRDKIKNSLRDNTALNTFAKMIEFQGVDGRLARELCRKDNPVLTHLPSSKHFTQLHSKDSGFVTGIDALAIADVCLNLGAGRRSKTDQINYGVGVILLKVVGDEVREGEPWMEIRHDQEELGEDVKSKAREALQVESRRVESVRLICSTICKD